MEKGFIQSTPAVDSNEYHTYDEMRKWRGRQLINVTSDGIRPSIPWHIITPEQENEFQDISSSIRDAIRQREIALSNRHDKDTVEAFRCLVESSAPDAKKKNREEPKLYFQMDGDEEPLDDEQLVGLLDMQYADTSLYSSLPLVPIESDIDIHRLLRQTKHLAVGRHYGAVALWLYKRGLLHLLGGWDIENEEPTRVLVISPDFLSRSEEAARAFEIIARQIPVIYDERQGDGFEYDIEICNHNLFFVPHDEIVPDELAWAAAKVSNRIFIRDLSTLYTYYDEPRRIRTISSWAMLEQDRIYLAMTLSRFGEDDPDRKAALRGIEELSHKHHDILDKIINVSLFGKHNMSSLAWQATLSCDDACQAWNNQRSGSGSEAESLLFDALEMEANDDEIEALLKQILDEFHCYMED